LISRLLAAGGIACGAFGGPAAAGHALERPLDLAEPDGALLWFLLHPVPDLLERHARQRTAHAALVADVLSLPAGQDLGRPPGRGRRWRR
jgi:LuxR family maltose regulon positive regulatory protein